MFAILMGLSAAIAWTLGYDDPWLLLITGACYEIARYIEKTK